MSLPSVPTPVGSNAIVGEVGEVASWIGVLSRSPEVGAAEQTVIAGDRGRLGLRRLPGTADPSTARVGDIGAIVWGEFYDLDETAYRFGLSGGAGPAEVAAATYRAAGATFASEMKGRFVAIVYDAGRDELVAARDRIGFVPLFTRRAGGDLEIAVNTDAFFALGAERPVIDRGVAAAYLAHQRLSLGETFIAGVSRVPPGHYLTVTDGIERTQRYWMPPPVGAGAEWVEESELPRFSELLDAAVGRGLARGRTAVFLSGGLDSVSVAAAAADRAAKGQAELPVALSLIFPGDVSEAKIQRGVAERLGMEFVPLDFHDALGDKGLLRSGIDLSARLSAPLQNTWAPAYDSLTALGKDRGIRAVLNGGGGDEWLTVTPVIAADYIASGRIAALWRYLQATVRSLPHEPRHVWRSVLWVNGLRPLLMRGAMGARARLFPELAANRARAELAAALSRLPSWVAPDRDVNEDLRRRVAGRFEVRRPTGVPAGGRYFDEMRKTLDHPIFAIDIEEIFEHGRRNDAPHYDVYWDADLVEFLYRVPPDLLIKGGRSKALVRDDLASRLPDFGFEAQKKLIAREFFVNNFFAEMGPAWEHLGGVEALAELGVVDPDLARNAVTGALEARDELSVDRLWRLMSLEAWARSR